jgi:hypothetical protein
MMGDGLGRGWFSARRMLYKGIKAKNGVGETALHLAALRGCYNLQDWANPRREVSPSLSPCT